MNHPVVHFEIPYDEEERAKTFYKEAFEWKIMDWPLEDGSNYVGIQTGAVGEDNKSLEKGEIGGGMVPRSQAQTPILTLKTEDAESAASKAESLGATRVSSHTYPQVGTMIYMKDTEGNLIGLWEDMHKK
jgi:predicted enzyme related to lactoylglutathione lyase